MADVMKGVKAVGATGALLTTLWIGTKIGGPADTQVPVLADAHRSEIPAVAIPGQTFNSQRDGVTRKYLKPGDRYRTVALVNDTVWSIDTLTITDAMQPVDGCSLYVVEKRQFSTDFAAVKK